MFGMVPIMGKGIGENGYFVPFQLLLTDRKPSVAKMEDIV